MLSNEDVNIDAVYWIDLNKWVSKPGDWIIYNGFFFSWYGFVIGMDEKKNVIIRYSGLPILLVTNTKEKMKKIHFNKIRYSKGGKFSIFRVEPKSSLPLWFLG